MNSVNSHVLNVYRTGLLLSFVLLVAPDAIAAAAADVSGMDKMAENMIKDLPTLRGFQFDVIALIGFFIFAASVRSVANIASNETHQQHKSYGAAVIGIIVGTSLMNLAWAMTTVNDTIFPSPFQWVENTSDPASSYSVGQPIAQAAMMWLQFIGVIMFAKGLLMFNDMGKSESKTWGAAASHTIGGMLLANVVVVMDGLSSFSGFKNPLVALGVSV